MDTPKELLKEEDLQLLKTGINDYENLLNEDELNEIFGGYYCHENYITCYQNYLVCIKKYYTRQE